MPGSNEGTRTKNISINREIIALMAILLVKLLTTMVEMRRLELLTSAVQRRRSPN